VISLDYALWHRDVKQGSVASVKCAFSKQNERQNLDKGRSSRNDFENNLLGVVLDLRTPPVVMRLHKVSLDSDLASELEELRVDESTPITGTPDHSHTPSNRFFCFPY
jgi:hypothetical protein